MLAMSWTSETARSELNNLLKQHAVGAEELSDKTELVADLGIDSLGVMELVADVEDKFDLAIEDAELREIVTVGDVLGAIEKRLRDSGRWQE
jgi:acyl carrier protein